MLNSIDQSKPGITDSVSVKPRYKQIFTLLNAVTSAANGVPGPIVAIPAGPRTIQSIISGNGSISGSVDWYGSNLNSYTGGIRIDTSLLAGTEVDQSSPNEPFQEWPFMWAVPFNITGTGAVITANLGV